MINEKVRQLKKELLSYCKKHPEHLAELQPALDRIEKLLQEGEDTSPENVKSWWKEILSKIISHFGGDLIKYLFCRMTSGGEDEDL